MIISVHSYISIYIWENDSPKLQEAVWISEQCGLVRLNSPDQLTEQKQEQKRFRCKSIVKSWAADGAG